MKELSWEELNEYGKQATAAARKSAFDAGTFYCYAEGDKVIRVYPDGRKTEVIYDGNGNQKEIKLDDPEK
ncbi:hypothetical protein [Paenibacillus macquariensis]|uniref:Uncharacterized protein n=1 Tax=Paenibacillus macquariensis TaxID=948756 RepID=A0ABY1KD93_9BACL|nr:hypothetical protein [Paenibacillus macquariensis]MEC0094320.1 hypothetical protein [Paenibacillus macquariensis]OAB26340.1 hypothetical protein PMSM_26920 [Paenibacillus macquariensis subsp. macquariensis]SIR64299.1 hypothetical protein SAMN05421578_12614 [Paenibacillus macquariensis]